MTKIYLLFFYIISTLFVSAQIPNGYYYSAANHSGQILQQTLHDIIDNHTVISYDELWTAFYTTDDLLNGKVWDIYSYTSNVNPAYYYTFGQMQCGNYSGEGDCYNREHSFPKSWFNDASPMLTDLFQVYPTDGYVNGRRSNLPFGETDAPTWTSTNGSKLGPCSFNGYSGTVFEPIDEFKGDLARTYFYMATRYYGEDANWPGSDMVNGAQPNTWALNLLLKWDENDPVSQKEIDRNNAIYTLQGNRNPFIDHPEYVSYIWEGAMPENPVEETETPTHAVSNFSTSFITLHWTDATGENKPGGYLILISDQNYDNIPVPADGTSPEIYTTGKVINYGIETCTFSKLLPQHTYYFKIFSFNGSGINTDYKTDGSIPQLQKTTN